MTAPATPPTEATSTPTPPSTSPSSEVKSTEPYRFPADHPEVWARGRTAEEVLALTKQLDQTVQQLVHRPPAPQAQAPTPQNNGFDVADEDYITGAQLKRLAAQFRPGPDPRVERAFQAASETALSVVERDSKNKEAFERYAPEIRATIAQMQPELRTLDNLQAAVDYVVGKHWRDLVASEAQRFAAENPTMRSTGGAGSGSQFQNTHTVVEPLDNPAIPEDQRRRLKDLGLSNQQIREHCAANDMTVEQFVKLYAPIQGTPALEVQPATTKRTI